MSELKMTNCEKHFNVRAELCPVCLMEERDIFKEQYSDIVLAGNKLVDILSGGYITPGHSVLCDYYKAREAIYEFIGLISEQNGGS